MSVYEITFSPTGGTNRVTHLLTNNLGEETSTIDLTDYKADFHRIALTKEDLAVISVPSFGGRVPATAVQRLTMTGPVPFWSVSMATVPMRTPWWNYKTPPSRLDSMW